MRALILALLLAPAARASSDMSQPGVGPGTAVIAATLTATSYSSAPVVYVSTIAALTDSQGSQRIYMYTNGILGSRLNESGRTRMGPGTASVATTQGTLDLVEDGSTGVFPYLYLRNSDTSISAGDDLGGIVWRIDDTSTGGATEKAKISVKALTAFASADQYHPVQMDFNLGVVGGGNTTSYMTLTSTAAALRTPLLIKTSAVAADAPAVVCSTCILQVVAPSGSGVSITGRLQTSDVVGISTTATGGTSSSARMRIGAGTGVGGGAACMSLYQVAQSSAGPASVATFTMYSFTIPANTLSVNDMLYFVASATYTATNQAKVLDINFNGTRISGASTTTTRTRNRSWGTVGVNSTPQVYFEGINEPGAGNSNTEQGTISATLSSNINVTVTSSAADGLAGSATGTMFSVLYCPAP